MAPESADIDLAAVRRYRGRQTGTLSQSNLFMVVSMHELLNLGAFPLDRPNSPEWRELVDQCRQDLAADGIFNLHGFMRADVAASEVQKMKHDFDTRSFRQERSHNIYFEKNCRALPLTILRCGYAKPQIKPSAQIRLQGQR